MMAVCQQQTDLATGKVCCGQIAFLDEGFDNWGMVKRPRKPTKNTVPAAPRKPSKAAPQLHLGLWLARLSREQKEVAEAAGIGKSYMSHLVSGKKKNPASDKVLLISIELGVTVNDLYKPPPPRAQMDQLKQYEPTTIHTLIDSRGGE